MKLIRGIDYCSLHLPASVVTLGNFDGVHLGHQALLQKLMKVGKASVLPTVVITFEPQPKEFFTEQSMVARLMRFREKWAAFKKYPIDYVLCLRFEKKLAALSAEDFVKKILVERLQAKILVVGDDFRFGAKRAGHIALLKQLGNRYGFDVVEVPTVMISNQRVSSTRMREALEAGDMILVKQLLNGTYRLWGKVIHGDKRGRILGFPTANINLHRKRVPLAGVFVVRVFGINQRIYDGVAHVGTRSMFGDTRVLLEVYLFDFKGDLYGCNLEIEFLHKLRDEEHYNSPAELVKQIEQDVIDAKKYFLEN